ncbi:transglutaminase domain-containing protein [Marinirhabdus gelatinilytica]|nr:transglutaminase domain-containing protein [Marinirhabdus gelatinilytica]
MRHILQLFFLAFVMTGVLQAQDFSQVDATIKFYPKSFDEVTELSDFIARDFKTDEEKVRAIYGWIIHNVAYDLDEYDVFNYKFKNYRERNAKEEITRIKIIQRTLQKGVAVCEGYAMLFEKLCELQGIQNYLVRGDIKTSFKDIGRSFQKIHMWNVAYINGEPFLFDPTWGAGKYNQRFIKEPSYYWYKTEPKLFIKSHYPDLVEDTFLEINISKQVFARLPLIIKKDLLVTDVLTPKYGMINQGDYGKEIEFELKTEAPSVISYSYDFGDKKKMVDFSTEGDLLKFPIKKKTGELIVYFNDKPALAYKVE